MSIGIGERRRSILPNQRLLSKRLHDVFEGVKVMLHFVECFEDQRSLVSALNTRFHIRTETAKTYLCLLFLLVDNQEGETLKSKLRMERNVICVLCGKEA